MKQLPHAVLLLFLFSLSSASAMITGSTGNDPVENHFWPTGSEKVANLKSRVAHWTGPIGSGETFEYRGTAAELNTALKVFARIATPKRELILRNGPATSTWLKIMPVRELDPERNRIDWSFVVWSPYIWHQLFNDPRSSFAAEIPGFRQPVDPPRIIAYFGGEGKLVWKDVEVPEGITVIDQRGTPGKPPSFTGGVYDMNTGKAIVGATVTVSQGRRSNDGTETDKKAEAKPLPVTTTDAAGRFVLEGFAPGAYVAVVEKDGYAKRTSGRYETFRGSDTREVTLHLAKEATFSGMVLDTNGEPLEDVRIRLSPRISKDGLGYSGTGTSETRTDAEGRFTLVGLPEGYAGLSAHAANLTQMGELMDLYEVPNEEPVEIIMGGTGTVTGFLKAAEGKQVAVSIEPVGGIKIGTWGGSANCKEDGTFEFKNVPPGDYLIGPARGDLKEGDPGVESITVKAGGTITIQIIEE